MYFTDLKQSLEAVASAMPKCLDENNNFLPSAFPHWENAHDSGRWIEAVLLLEDVIGFEIPKKLERAMLFNFKALMSNPYGLLINDRDLFENKDDVRLHYHSLREALLALTMLVRYRNSKWAVGCGEKLIDTIDRRFFENTLTDNEIRSVLGIEIPDVIETDPNEPVDPFSNDDETRSTGRAIEALLQFYKATGSEKALIVLKKCVEWHCARNLHKDGSSPDWMTCKEHLGHNHSYLGTLRGLLMYGIEFNNTEIVESVYNTYKNCIFKYNCSYSGYAPHDLSSLRFADDLGDPLGDHASCADVIYIAYLLAYRGGYTELFDDVQRLIRARLLRLQQSEGDSFGTWGITGDYFGKGTTIDVFCLIASTLSEIYRTFAYESSEKIYYNLYFSKELPSVTFNAYRDEKQHLEILLNGSKDIYIRISEWCPIESLSLVDSENKVVPYSIEDEFLIIKAENALNKKLHLSYILPKKVTTETTWNSDISYSIDWLGDDIIGHKRI